MVTTTAPTSSQGGQNAPPPFNISIMNVDEFIRGHGAMRVTSTMIKEPSSLQFHPEGLFSESIFGKIGSQDRLTRFGFIELNTEIIAPAIFSSLRKLAGPYVDIAAGRIYATWDEEAKDFVRIEGDPEDTEGARTGYNFFMEHFREVSFKQSDSLTREARIQLLSKYREVSIYGRYLVEPAGLRDIGDDLTGKLIQDDINPLYQKLLSYTLSLPPNSTSDLYDSIRFNIQSVACEIYDYLDNMMSGKRGFLQGVYAHRKIAMGTRNVISASTYVAARPDDPKLIKPDETIVGVYQCMKAVQGAAYFQFKSTFIDPIFGEAGSTYTIPLINPKTLNIEYKEIPQEEAERFTTSDGINSLMNRFANIDTRAKPITIQTTDLKKYYLSLVYDDHDRIILFRSLKDLQNVVANVKMECIRPLTWIEAFYLITENVVQGKHAFVTRYPVLGDGSCYPSKIHLTSTAPSRTVTLVDAYGDTTANRVYAEYPIIGSPYCDTVVPNSNKLAGLGGD